MGDQAGKAPLGFHIAMDLDECNTELLDDIAFVTARLRGAAATMGTPIVGETSYRFIPRGVTVVLAIRDSHVSIHTWPELGFAALDLFTCGSQEAMRTAALNLVSDFGSAQPTIWETSRGQGGHATARRRKLKTNYNRET